MDNRDKQKMQNINIRINTHKVNAYKLNAENSNIKLRTTKLK